MRRRALLWAYNDIPSAVIERRRAMQIATTCRRSEKIIWKVS